MMTCEKVSGMLQLLEYYEKTMIARHAGLDYKDIKLILELGDQSEDFAAKVETAGETDIADIGAGDQVN